MTLIFSYLWWSCFFEEKTYLRTDGKKILLVMDIYKCHIAYKVLFVFFDNGVVFAGLPAHKSHVLLLMDVSVLGPLKY